MATRTATGTTPPQKLTDLFDTVINSGEIGFRKPDPSIFRYLLERLELPAEEVVFIDDADVNTDAAISFGIPSILHVDASTTRAALASLLGGETPAGQAVQPSRSLPQHLQETL